MELIISIILACFLIPLDFIVSIAFGFCILIFSLIMGFIQLFSEFFLIFAILIIIKKIIEDFKNKP